jgi:NADPH:quinone reductase-like Zn-dependent oxidoreductase
LFAVQFARWKGAQVIGVTSTANVDFVRSLGAEAVIDYTSTPFEQVVHDVDLALDTMGGEILRRTMDVVKPGGTLVSLVEQLSPEQARERGIRAVKNTARLSRDLLQTIAQMIDKKQVRAIVGKTFSLTEVRQAHELSQGGHGRGRIVLHIAD